MSETELKLSETERLKCEACGADLAYDASTGKMLCAHCGSAYDLIGRSLNIEKDFFAGVAEDAFWNDEALSYRCENCGAVTVMNKGEIASHCPFCGASKVITVEDQAGIKPMAVIPFAFDRDKAKEFYLKWIKKRLFAPRKLKKNFTAKSVNNVYVPCWTYDVVSSSTYRGRLGEYYTVTVGSGKNRRTERRIRWYFVSGVYDRDFDDIAIEASSYVDQNQFDKIQPYDTNNALDYNGKYLAGATAERYRVGVADCFDTAKIKMESAIRREILNRYHADVVDYLNVFVTYEEVRYKYVLLPIWVCNFAYNKKTYNFFVNGQTGKTAGKTPISPLRVLTAVLLGLVALAGVVWILYESGVFS